MGRSIPIIAPHVTQLTGVDNSRYMLRRAGRVARDFPNVDIRESPLEDLSDRFPRGYFDHAVCAWSTLGNVENDAKVLREIASVTSKSVILTLHARGALSKRRAWYKHVGVKPESVDSKTQTFVSQTGLTSRAYPLEDVKRLARQSGLSLLKHGMLGGVMLWAELDSNSKRFAASACAARAFPRGLGCQCPSGGRLFLSHAQAMFRQCARLRVRSPRAPSLQALSMRW